jgi:heat shock protein HslJ
MRKLLTPLVLLLTFCLVAAACGDDDDDTTAGVDGSADDGGDGGEDGEDGGGDVTGIDGVWVLVTGTVDGTDLVLLDSHPVTLVVEGTEVSGVAACNTYGGPFTVSGGTASFGPLAQTEMACFPEETMTLEAAYLGALSRGDAIGVDGDQLVVTGDGVELRFDAQAPVEDAALEGTAWTLDTIIDGDSASTPVGSGNITFAADGTVSGSTGCNTFNGSYEAADGTLTIGPLATTRKGCPADLGAQETHVLAVLGATPTYTIEGLLLTIMAADGSGLAFRA